MIGKRIEEITKADIESLITDKVGESKTIDFKRELPGGKDAEKKEFLADVSSFANAAGGDIILGIEEGKGSEKGIAKAVIPISSEPADSAILRLEETIRNGIDPRLKVQMKAINGLEDDKTGYVLLIRIPQSISSPHMVTYQGTSKFFSRNNAGKFQLDVHELRESFLVSESQSKRIRGFVEERLGKIIAGETPLLLRVSSSLVLHIIPVESFIRCDRIPLQDRTDVETDFWPYGSPTGMSKRFSLDGLVTYTAGREASDPTYTYTQLFFDGTVETVYGDISFESESKIKEFAIDPHVLIKHLKRCLIGMRKLGLSTPMLVFLSLHGVKGARIYLNTRWPSDKGYPIDRDTMILPAIKINDFDSEPTTYLRPIFDAIWNAAGYPKSPYYNENGDWVKK